MTQLIFKIITFTFIVFGINSSINAQSEKSSEVYKTLKAYDSLIFESAFNHCELEHLDKLISEDFEFYHDIGGITNSKEAFLQIMKNGICNPNNATKSTRELVKESLEVYLLKENGKVYGAIQNGIHKFFETTNGNRIAGSEAKFSHVWIIENEKWRLKRVLSFDHQKQKQLHTKTVNVSESKLNSYSGKYLAKASGLVTISKIDKGLHLSASSMEADIYPKSQTLFAHQQAPLTFEFISDAKGETIKFIVRENDAIVEEAIKK